MSASELPNCQRASILHLKGFYGLVFSRFLEFRVRLTWNGPEERFGFTTRAFGLALVI